MLVALTVVAASLCLPSLNLLAVPAAPADAPPTPTSAEDAGPATQPPAGTIPLIPYSDPTFGFQMQVPAGWVYDRTRFGGPQGSVGVLRGRNPNGQVALQILIFRSDEITDFDTWLRTFVSRLSKNYGGKKIAEQRVTETESGDRSIPGERAILFVETGTASSLAHTYYLCIPFDPSTVWVLIMATPIGAPSDAEQCKVEFHRMADSVRVLYDPLEAAKLEVAFQRGMEVLAKLRATAADVEIDENERFYDVLIGGKSIGYVSRWARRERRSIGDPRYSPNLVPGLRVHEEVWRFADDGTVRQTVLDMFSSADLTKELIENHSTQIPAPDVPSQRLFIQLDQCVREGHALVSSFSTNLDAELPEPRPPLPIGPRYLDLAWVRLLPRLLLDAPLETYAFAIYDSETHGLIICTIEPLGPVELPGPRGGRTYVFETREGFVAQPSRIYTDEHGQIVRVESGDLAMVLTTADQVQHRYGALCEAARQRMAMPGQP
jgi:hypothetical protein